MNNNNRARFPLYFACYTKNYKRKHNTHGYTYKWPLLSNTHELTHTNLSTATLGIGAIVGIVVGSYFASILLTAVGILVVLLVLKQMKGRTNRAVALVNYDSTLHYYKNGIQLY